MESKLKSARQALDQLIANLQQAYRKEPDFLVIGIADGGISLAEFIAERLDAPEQAGIINPLFHRDDIGLKPIPKHFRPTSLPFEIDGRHVLLVDDVFASGRTLRAALNELFDHGRPDLIRFAVLFDIEQRAMPYKPDFGGQTLPLDPPAIIHVHFSNKPEFTCNYEITTS